MKNTDSFVIGFAAWVGLIAISNDVIISLCLGPFLVSGIVLAGALMKGERNERRTSISVRGRDWHC